MAKRDFDEVQVAFVEGNSPLRMELRTALLAKGIRNPIVCKDPESFLEVTGNETLDVILCDANTFGTGFSAALQRIRRNDVGGNPFVVAIATVHDATMDGVRAVLDSGVDDVLLKPTPVMRIIDRIDNLIWERRPFVVTNGYVGPTRRGNKRPTDNGETVLEIPNTLHCKVVDKMGVERLRRMIDQAVAGLQEKMEQHPLLGIDRLIQRTIDYSQSGQGGDELRRDFGYLMALGLEMSNRYRGTALAHIAELAVALANLAKRIATKSPGELRLVDLDPLSNLGEVIRRSIAAEERSADTGQAGTIRLTYQSAGFSLRP